MWYIYQTWGWLVKPVSAWASKFAHNRYIVTASQFQLLHDCVLCRYGQVGVISTIIDKPSLIISYYGNTYYIGYQRLPVSTETTPALGHARKTSLSSFICIYDVTLSKRWVNSINVIDIYIYAVGTLKKIHSIIIMKLNFIVDTSHCRTRQLKVY